MNKKLTRIEKYWILYDVGNSAFVLLIATILPIYFNHLASLAHISEVDYLAYWGYASSLTTIIVAIIGPILGSIVDTKGYKKPIFTISMMIGVLGLAALSVPRSWIIFLAVFVIAKVGYSASLIFYDSMLIDITSHERMDYVSSQGYAWGYIGSCIPFIISLVIVLFYNNMGISFVMAMTLAFLINALWWLIVTIPLLKNYQQKHFVEKPEHPVKESFIRLKNTFKDIKKHKKIFMFLLSFFFYIDGVYTIIDMATAYGTALGLNTEGLLLALLLTQIVAFPFALLFGTLSKTIQTQKLLQFCILAYTGIAIFAIQLDKQWEFWLLAVLVGMFQGAIQALSRSYFAKIIPAEKSGEFFGIFDICGKGAAFVGTALVGLLAQLTGQMNLGIAAISIMFMIGFIIFNKIS
ncbi:MFS transporter [[Clostridium] spiroforme]|nr:MFS transporter [Thomasclavelia spiroformis]MBM6880242.1 MFS transporter [Thomasclavelia spiroformis]